MTGLKIPFIGLRKQYHNLRQEILDATDEVLRSGQIMDANYTAEFENWLARRNNKRYAITCHSGTQALEIMADWYRSTYLDQPRVLVPSMTYPATVNAFVSAGWQVHLGDTDEQGCMDFERVDLTAIQAVVMVGLYGAPVDFPSTARNWALRLGLKNLLIMEDAAQHWLASDCNRIGTAAAISFDPTKNLNNYGNGGAIISDDSALMFHARAARNNGKPDHRDIGTNSRMSEVDCAQMLIKTRYIDQWQSRRREIARYWITRLKNSPVKCLIDINSVSEHAVNKFVIMVDQRDQVREQLTNQHIETRVHYERPCHELNLFRELPGPDILSKASALSRRVISLPIYPELTDLEVDYVVDQVLAAVTSSG